MKSVSRVAIGLMLLGSGAIGFGFGATCKAKRARPEIPRDRNI